MSSLLQPQSSSLAYHLWMKGVAECSRWWEPGSNQEAFQVNCLNLCRKKRTCISFFSFFLNVYFFILNIIYCQIGLHTTPSAHSNRCPSQCPSLIFPAPPTSPSTLSLFFVFKSLLWVCLPFCLKLFFPLPFPHGLLSSASSSTYEWKHIPVFLWLTYFT